MLFYKHSFAKTDKGSSVSFFGEWYKFRSSDRLRQNTTMSVQYNRLQFARESCIIIWVIIGVLWTFLGT